MDTARHHLMREALLDETKCARLGQQLEARCRVLCLERTWVLWHYSHFASYGPVSSQRQWEDLSEKLYAAAAEVAKALRKQ